MIIWLIMNFRLVPSKTKRHGWISHAVIFLLYFLCATVALPPFRSPPFTNNSMTFADGAAQHVSESGSPIFTRYWAVEILEGEEVAREVAEKHGFIFLGTILPGIYYMKQPRLSRRSVHHSIHYHDQLANDPRVVWLEQQVAKVRVKRDVHIPVNDPHWADMWYLNRGGPNGLDMNVRSAWARGYAGQDVVVTILDDGLEIDHPDLKENYDPFASYDVNGNDANPEPRYPSSDKNPASNRHGTRCAGEVAAVANNSICGLGIAYRARIGGVRMLDGDVSDAMESRSLGYQLQHIDVYSASWGPEDDGKTVDGPGRLAQMAFRNGIVMGRGGLGSVFVWASGNGGKNGDNCNCDGYTNSIYTLGVSSVSERGSVPWYAEMCSSTLAVTYSSGGQEERGVITTDLNHTCTRNHSGTSASAPLAAGICALTLSANKRLTWRDLQYLVVYTARPEGLNASDWRVNGVGRSVSHAFGYGLMDAGAMVDLAINWTNVPPQRVCEAQAPITGGPVSVQRMSKEVLALTTDGCASTAAFAGDPTQCVVYLEHVQAKVTVSSAQRGEIELRLTSPSGTESILLSKRPKDMDVAGFHAWPFMSVHFWGEMANGTWKLTVYSGKASVSIHDWILILYGTNTPPPLHASSHRRGVRQLPKNEVVSGIGSLHDNTGSRSVVLESRSSQPFQNHVHPSVLRPNHPLGFASSDSVQKDGHSVSIGKVPFPFAHVPRPQLPPPLPPPPPDPNDLWADWKPPSLKTHLPPLSSTLHLNPMQSQLLLDHIQSEAEVSDTAASKSSSDAHFTSVLHADWPQLPLLFNHQIFDHSGGDTRYQDPLADVKEPPEDNENRPTKKTGEMTSVLPNIVAHQMPSESTTIPHSWFICLCASIVSFGLT